MEGGGRKVEKPREGRGTARGEKEHKLKVDQTAQESNDVMTKEEETPRFGDPLANRVALHSWKPLFSIILENLRRVSGQAARGCSRIWQSRAHSCPAAGQPWADPNGPDPPTLCLPGPATATQTALTVLRSG